jgi:hypothetical protein
MIRKVYEVDPLVVISAQGVSAACEAFSPARRGFGMPILIF